METSISITMDSNGVKKQKSVSYIDPNAENTSLVAFASGLVSLTSDSYESTTRIDRTECDTAPVRADYPITRMDWIDNSTGSTVTTTFTVSNPVINAKTNSFSNKQFQIRIQVPYISAPTISASSENWTNLKMQYGFVSAASLPVNTWVIALYNTQESVAVENFNVTLHFDGNSQYKPFDLTIAVSITEAGD